MKKLLLFTGMSVSLFAASNAMENKSLEQGGGLQSQLIAVTQGLSFSEFFPEDVRHLIICHLDYNGFRVLAKVCKRSHFDCIKIMLNPASEEERKFLARFWLAGLRLNNYRPICWYRRIDCKNIIFRRDGNIFLFFRKQEPNQINQEQLLAIIFDDELAQRMDFQKGLLWAVKYATPEFFVKLFDNDNIVECLDTECSNAIYNAWIEANRVDLCGLLEENISFFNPGLDVLFEFLNTFPSDSEDESSVSIDDMDELIDQFNNI